MPSAAEIRDGDLLLRPWNVEDAEAVGVTFASPEIGRYFGLPFEGFPEPDPDAPSFSIVANGVDNGRSQRVAERAGYQRDGEIADYARFADGTTRALRFVRKGV